MAMLTVLPEVMMNVGRKETGALTSEIGEKLASFVNYEELDI